MENLTELTEADQARHLRAVEKLRTQLFRIHPPESYRIIPGTEKVIPPVVSFCNVREVALGGLSYEIRSPNYSRAEFQVQHKEGSQFLVFALCEYQDQTFTRLAISMSFAGLNTDVLAALKRVELI